MRRPPNAHSEGRTAKRATDGAAPNPTLLSGPLLRRRLIHIALIVAALVVTMANSLPNGFHLDDYHRIVDNPGVRGDVPPWRHFVDPTTSASTDRIVAYRPLLPLTLSLNGALSWDTPAGYRVGNLLAHGAAAILVYFLALAMLARGRATGRGERDERSDEGIALVAALLFAVHPVSGIVVNYLSARDLALMQALLMASLVAYASPGIERGARVPWIIALAALACSLLSKTNPVVAPMIVIAWETTIGGRRLVDGTVWKRAAPFAAVVAGFLLIASVAMGATPSANVVNEIGLTPWVYALTQLRLHLLHYAFNVVWPFTMRMNPDIPPASGLLDPGVLAGLAFVAGSLVLAWRTRRSAPAVSFCILAYWFLMLPESSIVPLHHIAVDYRAYPSSPFLFVAVGIAAVSFAGRRTAAFLGAAAVLYAAASSVALNPVWRTDRTLWERSVRLGGDALAHVSYALSFEDPRALEVRMHLEEAVRLDPEFANAHLNLGLVLIASGEIDPGLEALRRSAELSPSWPESWTSLARGYALAGRAAEAYAAMLRSVALRPHDPDSRVDAARLAIELGRTEEARAHLAAAEQAAPGRPDAAELRRRLGDRAGVR